MKNKHNFLGYLVISAGLTLLFAEGCRHKYEATEPMTAMDVDSNIYHIVTIGTQTWMVENLKTTKYRNGESIQNMTGSADWYDSNTGAYCNYNNDASYCNTYGCLYNWYAATDSRNIAPVGWHIPSKDEWAALINYLGGEGEAGARLKESGTTHWIYPNSGADNSSGFSALPGGSRVNGVNGDTFGDIGMYGAWWSSTEGSGTADGSYITMCNLFTYANSYANYKNIGFSVRCIKD